MKHTHAKNDLIGLQDFGVVFHFWAGVCPDVSSLSERCGFETRQSQAYTTYYVYKHNLHATLL